MVRVLFTIELRFRLVKSTAQQLRFALTCGPSEVTLIDLKLCKKSLHVLLSLLLVVLRGLEIWDEGIDMNAFGLSHLLVIDLILHLSEGLG